LRRNKFHREDPKAGVIYNDKINAKQVRVSFEDGESKIMSKFDAMDIATKQDKDLILVSEKSTPPVCKIVNLNKFLYEKKQREKEAAKRARANVIETKEIRMSLNIGQNDIDVKCNNIVKMLDKGCKVTLTVILKGRERVKQNLARDLLTSIAERLEVEIESFSVSNNRISTKIK
jgi:translation initiation factor IF-3